MDSKSLFTAKKCLRPIQKQGASMNGYTVWIFSFYPFFYRWFLCWKNAMPRITFLSLYGYFILPYFFSDDFYAEKVQFLELSFYYNELQLGRNMFKRILVFLLQWIVAKAKHVYRILILFRVYHPYNLIVKLITSGHSFFFLGWSVGIVKWELGFIVFFCTQIHSRKRNHGFWFSRIHGNAERKGK